MLQRRISRRTLLVLFVLATMLALIVPAYAQYQRGVWKIQILAVNDFHGNLEATSTLSFNGVPAGGVEYLATHIANKQAASPAHKKLVVSAGDLIGASPLISALFHDEPTIEAFNEIGLDYNAVGNHEFDEGAKELKRMQKGGCHPVDGCLDGDGFDGADFKFLAANVTDIKTGETIFPAMGITQVKNRQIAIIGMTLEGTPNIVSPSGVAGLRFMDEADTVNKIVGRLKSRGIETIIVLVHEGGFPSVGTEFNACPGISGPIIDIVNRTSDEVDLFITGHTHQAYNCIIDDRPVVSASSFGRVLTEIDLQIRRNDGEVQSIAINNQLVTRDVPKDADMTSLIAKYGAISTPLANRVIGSISADIKRAATRQEESSLGSMIADAQLAATADPGFGDAVIAMMNPGGVRADLLFASSTAGEGDGNVTYGEAFTVQPFGNSLVTMTLTGAQIEAVLEQQFATPVPPATNPVRLLLQVSEGFTFAYSVSGTIGNMIDPASIMLNGVTLDPNAEYRVTVNSFLADGGDGFTVFREGTDRLGGDVDLDALEKYLTANAPVPPPALGRVTVLP